MAVGVVCAVGCIFAVRAFRSVRTGPPPDIQGTWQGVDFGKRGYKGRAIQHSRIMLKLYESNGVYSTTWDYIDLERTNAWREVIRNVVYKFPRLRFDEEPWGTRTAIINDDGSIMTVGSGDNLMVMERAKNPAWAGQCNCVDWLRSGGQTPRAGGPSTAAR